MPKHESGLPRVGKVKRVRQFHVCISDVADSVASSDRSSPIPSAKASNDVASERWLFDSWHKLWDSVVTRLSETPDEIEVTVFDQKLRQIVAHFSNVNLQSRDEAAAVPTKAELETGEKPKSSTSWESIAISEAGSSTLYENRNVQDYYWDLLEGARREVPFRLTYFERKAKHNSAFAFGLGLIQEWRDMFVRQY